MCEQGPIANTDQSQTNVLLILHTFLPLRVLLFRHPARTTRHEKGGRYEGSKEHSSGIDRCWQLGLVRTCPGAEAPTGVRDRSYLQPTQGSGEGGRYGVWHSSRSREFGCVGEGPIGRPGPGANYLSAT